MSLSGKRAWALSVTAALTCSAFVVSLSAMAAHGKPKIADASATQDPIVEVDTTKGPIKMKIFKKEAPITADNFLDLVSRHFYDGLSFHRYVEGFVIQGGDPTGTGTGNFVDPKTGQVRHIKLEKVGSLRHDAPGVVAMARSADPDSASCQWYITLAPKPYLDQPPGYAVFGKVVDGMENVMKLRAGDKMTKVFVVK